VEGRPLQKADPEDHRPRGPAGATEDDASEESDDEDGDDDDDGDYLINGDTRLSRWWEKPSQAMSEPAVGTSDTDSSSDPVKGSVPAEGAGCVHLRTDVRSGRNRIGPTDFTVRTDHSSTDLDDPLSLLGYGDETHCRKSQVVLESRATEVALPRSGTAPTRRRSTPASRRVFRPEPGPTRPYSYTVTLEFEPSDGGEAGLELEKNYTGDFVCIDFQKRNGRMLPAERSGLIQPLDKLRHIAKQSVQGCDSLEALQMAMEGGKETGCAGQTFLRLVFESSWRRLPTWICPDCTYVNAIVPDSNQSRCERCKALHQIGDLSSLNE
jgi:hypothetical protein